MILFVTLQNDVSQKQGSGYARFVTANASLTNIFRSYFEFNELNDEKIFLRITYFFGNVGRLCFL